MTTSPDDTAGDRWQIGESLPIGAIRDMEDPTLFGDPDRMGSPNYTLDEVEGDSGGVHSNSGVNNKAAFSSPTAAPSTARPSPAWGSSRRRGCTTSSRRSSSRRPATTPTSARRSGRPATTSSAPSRFTAANCVEVRDAVAATEMLTNDGGAPEGPACPIGQSPAYVALDDLESGTGLDRERPQPGPSAWTFDSGYATSGDTMLYGAEPRRQRAIR